MVSRFKSDDLKAFLTEKYLIAALLSIFATFDELPILKITACSAVEKIKKAG